ncbi:MAG: hypothetical protein JWM36_2353 [Hyphomicrobiales bacterium]|nr:hypothetical protein [Hyphomicrobiales bacterium]
MTHTGCASVFMKYNSSDRPTAERIYAFYQEKSIIAREAAFPRLVFRRSWTRRSRTFRWHR